MEASSVNKPSSSTPSSPPPVAPPRTHTAVRGLGGLTCYRCVCARIDAYGTVCPVLDLYPHPSLAKVCNRFERRS
jgi:hypothetical protein